MNEAAVPPSVIAEAVAAAKGLLRLEGGQEDGVLERMAGAAFATAELFCGQVLVRREFAEAVEGEGWRRLSRRPVVAIEPLPGVAVGGYSVDIDARGTGWVRTPGRVTVRYEAGLAETFETLPAAVAHGVVLLVAHWFENRLGDDEPPAAVRALWRPYRRLMLRGETR